MSNYSIISNPTVPFLNSFLNSIKRNEAFAVLYDDDADGLCSAAVFVHMMERFGIRDLTLLSKSKENNLFGEDFYKTIMAKNIKTIFCLDFDPVAWGFLSAKNGLATLPFNLIVFDHHADNAKIYQKSISMFMRMFIHPLGVTNSLDSAQYCTSKLIYDSFSTVKDLHDIEWKILPGMIGDMNIIGWPDYIARVAAKNGVQIDMNRADGFFNSPFGLFAARVHMLGAKNYKDFENALQVLLKATSIADANSKLVTDPEVERIYNELITNYKTMATVDEQSKLTMIEIKAPYFMASMVSSIVSYLHPQETFLFYEDAKDGFYHVSIRSQHTQKNLGQIMDAICKQFPEAHGGGHAPAAGARVKATDFPAFLDKVKAALVA